MTGINIISWNVHGGVNPRNCNEFDVGPVISGSDIACLQEVPENFNTQDFYENIWLLEPSVHKTGESMGLAILSKFPIISAEHFEVPAPVWAKSIPERNITPHTKGIIVASIKLPWSYIRVGCIHMLPPYIFDVDEGSEEAIDYVNAVSDFIRSNIGEVDILAGDFNSSFRDRLMSNLGMIGVSGGCSTRLNGKSHDDILISESKSFDNPVIKESLSDHFLVEANVVF